MNLSFKKVDVINLFAEDLAGTRTFYQEVLGLELAFQDENVAVFKLENTIVCLRNATEAAGLIAPAAVASPQAGSRFLLAVFVDDVDAVCAELVQRGVVLLNEPTDRPWGMRNASFADPAGHIWQVGQDLDAN
jgi:catechol 2,3-dioxygenase-like lactoylglutathione lyase family enzyme